MELARLFLSSISRHQIWPIDEVEILSWVPFLPWEMPREAPTFYFNSASLRQTAIHVFSKRSDLVAGTRFDEVCRTLKSYLKEVLWPREYRRIRTPHETLLDCFASEADHKTIASDLEQYFAKRFDLKLFMMPFVCRGLGKHPLRPTVEPSESLSTAWVGTEADLLKFLGDRFSANVHFDFNNFPPNASGDRVLRGDDPVTPTWLVTLARHEELAIINLKILFGALVLAVGPNRPPNQTDTMFGGLAYTSRGAHGFGATWRVQLPAVSGNASVKPEYRHLPRAALAGDEAWETDFTLDLIDKISKFSDDEYERRVKTACYFVGMAFLADPVSQFLLHASALDALFGFDDRKLGTTAKRGIESYCGAEHQAAKKLELFLKIRGSLAHGRRTYPEESSSYVKFLKRFDEEPLVAVWRITRLAIVTVASDLNGYGRFLEKLRAETPANAN